MHEVNAERRHFVRRLEEVADELLSSSPQDELRLLASACLSLAALLIRGMLHDKGHELHREICKRMLGVTQNPEQKRQTEKMRGVIYELQREVKPYIEDGELQALHDHLRRLGLMPGIAHRRTLFEGEQVSHLKFYHTRLWQIHCQILEEETIPQSHSRNAA